MFKESIKMSWHNIIHNKMRSFLTVLGILIGVTAVIALISIVQGATNDITSQVMDMGANKVTIQTRETPLKKGLSTGDLESISALDNLKGVSPSVSGITNIVSGGNVMEAVIVQGRNEVHFANTNDLVKAGRGINILDVEGKNRVCLIGQDIVDTLFTTTNPIDSEIIINGITHTIIGTLERSNGFAGGNDNTIIVPYTTAMGLLSTGYISSVDIYMDDESLSDETTSNIESKLLTAYNFDENGFSIMNYQDILDTVKDMTATMSMLLAGIAAISLVVGGIGIMNMMLVTVTERTTEIGLRKALGAKPSAIQMQFVLEALFLSLFGGVLGLFFGVALSWVGSLLIGIEFTLVGYSIPLAFGFSAIIGLGFGYMPAKKASKLNPIDALRSV